MDVQSPTPASQVISYSFKTSMNADSACEEVIQYTPRNKMSMMDIFSIRRRPTGVGALRKMDGAVLSK